jgi:uncharacterized protein (DUF1810 family)
LDLQRFIDAQGHVYETALAELVAGRKRTHWIWFIFPQLAVLGRSRNAKFYGIQDLEEAKAYLAHPVLGERLKACSRAVLQHPYTPIDAIMGSIDAMKLRSCATLFRAAGDCSVFQEILDTFYDGVSCEMTEQHCRPNGRP